VYEVTTHSALVESTPLSTLTDETFEQLRNYIYDRLGIFLSTKKKYLLEGRLGKRLRMLEIQSFEHYVQHLKYGRDRDEEFEFLCNAVTINETFFFRNGPQLEAFERTLAPAFVRENKGRTLRVWSAGSSSGEEAYSLAMIYLEKLRPVYPDLRVEVIGTDISSAVLDTARRGEFTRYSIRNLPDTYLKRYFNPVGERFVLRDEVKALVSFQRLNLVDRDQIREMKNADIIFCCNVLIYFDQKAKIQVVADLYNKLNYRGYLFIGFSELLHGISSAFKVVSFPQTTGYRKE
jgi:chemotaxis protein methyltransferase CheR